MKSIVHMVYLLFCLVLISTLNVKANTEETDIEENEIKENDLEANDIQSNIIDNDKLLDLEIESKNITDDTNGKTKSDVKKAELTTADLLKVAGDVDPELSEALEKVFAINLLTSTNGSILFNGAALIYFIMWGVVFTIIGTAVLCYWVGCEYEMQTTTAAPATYGFSAVTSSYSGRLFLLDETFRF